VTPDIAAVHGLRSGARLAATDLDAIHSAQAREDAMASALRLVSYRQRSEKELRDRLRRRGTPDAVIDSTLARLKELRLVDDAAFATAWVENRDSFQPRSARLLATELRAKGVSAAVAEASTATVDEAAAAYRAGIKRARVLAGRTYEEFRRKVGEFLLRRGFDYETSREAVDALWREMSAGSASDADSVEGPDGQPETGLSAEIP
jgi:regulatory protein